MPTLDSLQARFSHHDSLQFATVGETVLVRIATRKAEALVSLKGGHVLQFTPRGQQDLLWLSPQADIGGSGPIRGGVPVCWPWFADHPADRTKPLHGFARTASWDLIAVDPARPDGLGLTLSFETDGRHTALWPHSARLTLGIVIGDSLRLDLETLNSGSSPFDITEALHAYFRVGEVERTTVRGLDGVTYLDKVDAFARKLQTGDVTFGGEVDRVYVGTRADTEIIDAALGRRISIGKAGSSSTVVWNPAAARAARMGDLGPDGWRRYVCVETTNAGDDIVTLQPGESHTLRAIYGIRPAA